MSRRHGFTLIELLVVIVVIAILAAIVVPRLIESKEKAVTAMLQSDLRYLATLQEAYWMDHRTYSSSPDDLAFSPSEGVTITLEGSRDGWGARADHEGTPETCAFYVGSTPPTPPATGTGAPECAVLP